MTEDEQETLRKRIHKMSDQVQAHELRLAEDAVQIRSLTERLDGALRTMATGDQLHAMESNLALQLLNAKLQLEGAVSLIREQVSNLKDDLTPIRKGINWVVTLVLGAVILAVLALVLKGNKP